MLVENFGFRVKHTRSTIIGIKYLKQLLLSLYHGKFAIKIAKLMPIFIRNRI